MWLVLVYTSATALRRMNKTRIEKKDRAADMVTKVKKFCEQARGRVLDLREDDVSDLWENSETISDKVEANNQELQTLLCIVVKATNF